MNLTDLKKKSIEIVSAIHGINTRLTVFGYSLPIDDFRNYITIQGFVYLNDPVYSIPRFGQKLLLFFPTFKAFFCTK